MTLTVPQLMRCSVPNLERLAKALGVRVDDYTRHIFTGRERISYLIESIARRQ